MSRTIKTLTADQADQLLAKIATPCDTINGKYIARRNHLIALLMLEAGLRVGEVVKLKRSDLIQNNLPVPTLTLDATITKSKRERSIPTSFHIKTAINTLAREHWTQEKTSQIAWAFTRTGWDIHLTTRAIEHTINLISVISIGVRITPHVLRHTFASRLMRTTNIRIVQELLGHRNLSSTQVYTHPNSNDLRKAIDSITE